MIKVKYYLDKADKNRESPIHLVIRSKGANIKVSIGEKIKNKDWDNKNQRVKDTEYSHIYKNKYLTFLKDEVLKYLESTPHTLHTDVKVKEKLLALINSRKENSDLKIACEEDGYYHGRDKVKFIDLFAGAGGFSQGFLQAESGS